MCTTETTNFERWIHHLKEESNFYQTFKSLIKFTLFMWSWLQGIIISKHSSEILSHNFKGTWLQIHLCIFSVGGSSNYLFQLLLFLWQFGVKRVQFTVEIFIPCISGQPWTSWSNAFIFYQRPLSYFKSVSQCGLVWLECVKFEIWIDM